MADDPRIEEIRAALADKDADKISWWTALDRIRAIVDRGRVRVFRYTKSSFDPVEQLPIYRVYTDGKVTRQQRGDQERNAGDGALEFLQGEVRHGRMAEVTEVPEVSRG